VTVVRILASYAKRSAMTALSQHAAREWIERWDRQQEVSLPDREERFTALIDAVEAGAGRADPLVLDIGCGPGSLAVRLAERLPKATIIGIDTDPVTLALARAAYPDLVVVDLDLREPGWPASLPLDDRKADVAVSTTALHWLPEPDLRKFYAELATVLKPGGLLLNGDHFKVDTPVLARLDTVLREREDQRRFPVGHAESWSGWWEAVAADPVLKTYSDERDRRRVDAHHGASESTRLRTHVFALEAAGFAEIGTLWQRGDNRLLCAVMPG
jgi:SAM-dependent methyltransferase